ncbi:MAG: HlyD family efflux transporter periplasmic adaptor subunit [Leptolyngbyaceae cyanobacterium MO_188.B28]|nr:HlyD family efflux transporter periplasmic adaptor subunit [Leptolyngbyaceae cyanobacterium MO_188.B28]
MDANRARQGKPFWLVMGALFFVGGVTLWTSRSLLQFHQAPVQEQALPLPKQVKVSALGRLEPKGRVVDVAASESGRISRLLVTEGEVVEERQILAYLDLYNVRLAERDFAASRLNEAQDLLKAETLFGEAQIQEANTRIKQIDRPQALAIAAQQETIAGLAAELSLARLNLKRFEDLERDGATTRQDLDRQRTRVEQLEKELASSQVTQRKLEIARLNDMENAQAQLQSAQANLVRSQTQIQVESAARNLALAESRLSLTVVRAPDAGQILKIYVEPGEAVSAFSTEPILAMGNTDQMYVVAEVYETDIGLVKPGQPVKITSRNGAFDQKLTGVVEQVGLQIFKNDVLDDDPAANADARVVEVRIRIDQSEVVSNLTNLQVDVSIEVES